MVLFVVAHAKAFLDAEFALSSSVHGCFLTVKVQQGQPSPPSLPD
jgi:hypothetical protein